MTDHAAALVAEARKSESGCLAISSRFVDGLPGEVVLVATGWDSERVALLWALHEIWFPEEDE